MSLEATIERFAGHLKDLIGVVGDARDKAESALSDVAAIEQRVTADIEGKLKDFETKIMGDVQTKLAAAVDDIGGLVASLTGSTSVPGAQGGPAMPGSASALP